MKQFKDMNQEEKDERAIHRMMQRKDKAEAKGKVYKPRMTGEMPRLIKEYPEQFTWMTGENVIAKTVDQVEVVKVNHSLGAANEFAEYQQGLLLQVGDENRKFKKELEWIRNTRNEHSDAGIQKFKRRIAHLEQRELQHDDHRDRMIRERKEAQEKHVKLMQYIRKLEQDAGIHVLDSPI